MDWQENAEGNKRLQRMIKRTIPAPIHVIDGTPQIGKDFDGVHSIPAAYLFDPRGNEIFRVGGDPGPPGRHYLNRRQLERALEGIEAARLD